MSRHYLVHRVYSLQIKDIRSIDLLSLICAKLEIEAFKCKCLALQLVENVKSFPIVIFIDDFGLCRNMYCSLTGVYAMSATLSTIDHQKSSSAHTLTLCSHGSDFNMVLSCLQTSLKALDRGKLVEINGQKQNVWASVIAFLDDIKQQQVLGEFLGAQANFCY